jgi:phosphohistidine phosphatase
MTRFYLVQHGAATPKTTNPDRPLTQDGVQAVSRMASFLAGTGVKIERVLHSGKLRAEQTAEILAQALVPGGELRAIEHINPNDPVRDFTGKLDKFGTGTMFVGHLPFMEILVAYLLCADETSRPVAFTPGTVVCLHDPAAGVWTLEWMVRPELITGRT